MTTKVVFEAGTIASAMKKAAGIAPSKAGGAFDTASGIIMDIAPGTSAPVIIRATDTEIFYQESLDSVSCDGTEVRWRLPSQLLANVVGTQSSSPGRTISFEQIAPTQLMIKSGTMKTKIFLNPNPVYPMWDASDSVSFVIAPNFGQNLKRIIWAADNGGRPVLNGFHLDGEYAIATDSYKICRVPMKIDIDEPLTVPAGKLASILGQSGDVNIGVDANGMFVVMPDDYTEIKTTVYGSPYVPVQTIIDMEYTNQIALPKGALLERIQRATQFSGTDRAPTLVLYPGNGKLCVEMKNPEIGQYGDYVDVSGQAIHEFLKLQFTPQMMLDALNNAPGESITFNYNFEKTNKPVRIDGAQGFQCWLAPRKDIAPAE